MIRKFGKNREKRVFPCEYCNKSFSKKSDVVRHRQDVKHGTMLCCPICSHLFKSKENLLEHQADARHTVVLQCTICQRQFASRAGLKVHSSRMHGVDLHDNNIRSVVLDELGMRHRCYICQNRFRTSKALRSHISKKHTKKETDGDKEFKVQITIKEKPTAERAIKRRKKPIQKIETQMENKEDASNTEQQEVASMDSAEDHQDDGKPPSYCLQCGRRVDLLSLFCNTECASMQLSPSLDTQFDPLGETIAI